MWNKWSGPDLACEVPGSPQSNGWIRLHQPSCRTPSKLTYTGKYTTTGKQQKKNNDIMIKLTHSWRSLKLEARLSGARVSQRSWVQIPYRPDFFFSGVISTTAQVVFIAAKIAFIFACLSAVQIYDIYVFTVASKLFLFLLPHLPRASKISIHKPQWARKT